MTTWLKLLPLELQEITNLYLSGGYAHGGSSKPNLITDFPITIKIWLKDRNINLRLRLYSVSSGLVLMRNLTFGISPRPALGKDGKCAGRMNQVVNRTFPSFLGGYLGTNGRECFLPAM